MPVLGRAILGITDAALIGHAVGSSAINYQDGDNAAVQSQQDARNRGGQINSGPGRDIKRSKADDLEMARSNVVSVATFPQRMSICSVDRPEEIVTAQFNPEKLKETIGVDWQRFAIPGLTYQPQQYANTNNVQYRFELFFTAAKGSVVRDISGSGAGTAPSYSASKVLDDILAARRQLHAWAVLRKNDQLGGIGDTQRLLFDWPNFISMTCNIVSAEFEYEQFNLNGQPIAFKCDVLLEEVRDVAIYAEDILAQGTIRSGRQAEKV